MEKTLQIPLHPNIELEGMLIPCDWDLDLGPRAVAFKTFSEERFYVKMDHKGLPLLEHIYSYVKIKGFKFIDDEEMPYIQVLNFEELRH